MTRSELFAEAYNAWRLGDQSAAEKHIRAYLEQDGDSDEAYVLLGNICARSGRHSEAAVAYRKAIEKNPENREALNDLGVICRLLGRTDEALAALRAAIRLSDDDATVHYNIGNVYKQAGDSAAAETAYRGAVARDPELSTAWNNLGTLLQAQGRNSEAMRMFRDGLVHDPNHPALHYNLGLAYEHENSVQEAMREYQLALRSRPGWLEALNNLAILQQRSGDLAGAAASLTELLKINPSHAVAHNNLGTVLAQLGRAEDACRHYLSALDVDPRYQRAVRNIAQHLRSHPDLPDGVTALARLVERNTDDIDLRFALADVCMQLDRLSEAETELTEILGLDSENTEALRMLGAAYFRQGRRDSADECFERIEKIDPGLDQHHLDLARLHLQAGEHDQALEHAQAYLTARPEDRDGALLVAEALLAAGRLEQAVEQLQQLHRRFPEDGRVISLLARAQNELGNTAAALETADQLVSLQGNRASNEDLNALNDSLELYERAVGALENDVWRRNLQRLADLVEQVEREALSRETEALEVEETGGVEDESIPILGTWGSEFLVESEDDSESLRLRDLAIEREAPAEDEAARSLLDLSQSQAHGFRKLVESDEEEVHRRIIRKTTEEIVEPEPAPLPSARTPQSVSGPEHPQPQTASEAPGEGQVREAVSEGGESRSEETGTTLGAAADLDLDELLRAAESLQNAVDENTRTQAAAGAEPSIPPARSTERLRPADEGVDRRIRLLDYLLKLAESLPPEKREQFMQSEMRLKIESLRMRLSGRPGLKRGLERYAPRNGRVTEAQVTSKRVADAMRFMQSMSRYLPDPSISGLLNNRLSSIVERLEQLNVKRE